MSALSALLKKQSEQNPSASYFNVDILKYQVMFLEHQFVAKLLIIFCFRLNQNLGLTHARFN